VRAVAAAIIIIIVTIVLMKLGVGQGETACVRDCQQEHCTASQTELADCSSPAFATCAAACREAKE